MKQREQGFNSHPMKATLTSSSTHFVNDETPATLRADLDWRRVAAHDLQMPTAPPIHRPAGWKSPAAQDRERGSAAARGYDARWRRMRLAFLAWGLENPAGFMLLIATGVLGWLSTRVTHERTWIGRGPSCKRV